MKKTLLAITSALLLGGAMTSANAQTVYYQSYDNGYQDNGYYRNSYYSNGYTDMDRDGVRDEYDNFDNVRGEIWDRDRDGVNDRYEVYSNTYRDRDHDGVPNRYDRYDNRAYPRQRYNAGRYQAPRNYRYVRYNVGSRLPAGYYGDNYLVDYRPYGLAPPPYGYRWNRVGNDAYLVSITNGLVRNVIYSLFY